MLGEKYLRKLEKHRERYYYERRLRQITFKTYRNILRTETQSKIRTFALRCASIKNLKVDGYSIIQDGKFVCC